MTLGWIIGTCAVVLLLLYISFIQYKRADKAENAANILADNMVQIQRIISESSALLSSSPLKAAFEADDEVGDFFRNLQSIQEILNQFTVEEAHEETSTDIQ